MDYWEKVDAITQDPCYFHGRPTANDCFYVLYNLEFNRIFLVAKDPAVIKELILILRSKIVLFPHLVQGYDIDNSCCLNWSLEKKPSDIMHDNGYNVKMGTTTTSNLICAGVPPDVDLALETQKYIFYCYHMLEKTIYINSNDDYFSMLHSEIESSNRITTIKRIMANELDLQDVKHRCNNV